MHTHNIGNSSYGMLNSIHLGEVRTVWITYRLSVRVHSQSAVLINPSLRVQRIVRTSARGLCVTLSRNRSITVSVNTATAEKALQAYCSYPLTYCSSCRIAVIGSQVGKIELLQNLTVTSFLTICHVSTAFIISVTAWLIHSLIHSLSLSLCVCVRLLSRLAQYHNRSTTST